MENRFEVDLLAILVRLNAITVDDAESIALSFKDSDIDQFDDFLLEEGVVEEEYLLQALSDYYQVPSFDVVGYFFERHYVRMFPKEILLRHRLIPLEVDENIMIMVTSNPNDATLLQEIGQHVSYDIRFYVGIGRDICDAVKEFYDKSDTEDETDQDIHEDTMLAGRFNFLSENGEDVEGEELIFELEPDEDNLG